MSTDPGPQPLRFPARYGLIRRDSVDSTMSEAQRLLPGLDGPTWIVARRQTAARGRYGKAWKMPPGNLAATLIFRPEASPAEAGRYSFLAANALFEALALQVERSRLAQKWPNDVLLDGGKVAGILLESATKGGYVDWLAIGIGVNLAKAPPTDGAAFAPVALAEAGVDIAPEAFLTVLADCMATQEDKLRTFGFPRIREDWLRHAAKLGEEITARTTTATYRGIFDTVDQAGNLILETREGPKIISAADVYF